MGIITILIKLCETLSKLIGSRTKSENRRKLLEFWSNMIVSIVLLFVTTYEVYEMVIS